MITQPLEYGTHPRVSPRRLARRALAVVGVTALCLWAVRAAGLKVFYIDRDSVQSALAGVQGGKVISVNGFDDGPGWTVAGAEVSVDGSAARTLSFQSPRRNELQSGSRMCVNGMGPYSVWVEVGDERNMVQYLDFGHDSEFRDVLLIHPTDVRDLAARYDEVEAFVLKEPSGTYTTEDNKVCTYRIRASK